MIVAEAPPSTYANIEIRPVGSLAETARLLGEVLGVSFTEDTRGLFDEYPAFIAELNGLRYALLGIPSPEDDIRDEPTTDFSLVVRPMRGMSPASKKDISDALISQIQKDGRLQGWRLK